MREDNFVLYKGPKGPASIPDVYQATIIKNYRMGSKWGVSTINGIAANSIGAGSLSFTSLTGITIVSIGGIGTPYKSGNSILFPTGTYWDLRLSDGTYIPDPNSGLNVADTGADGTPFGFTKLYNAGGSLYFLENGYNRVGLDMIPALESDTSIDVLGDPIVYTGVFNRLNFADGVISYGTSNPIFNKNAFTGNTYGLPEIWSSFTWDYNDGVPTNWMQSERTMDYIGSRINPGYKNTIMIKEIVDGVKIGISREEIFDPAISDKNYNILNMIYNNVPIP